MGISFDNSKFVKKINVNMKGKEYLEYLKYEHSLPTMFTKKQVKGMFIIATTIIIAIVALFAIKDIFKTTTVTLTAKQVFLNSVSSLSDITWDNLLKLFFIAHIEIIGLVFLFIGIAWLFHGFGFIIIKR